MFIRKYNKSAFLVILILFSCFCFSALGYESGGRRGPGGLFPDVPDDSGGGGFHQRNSQRPARDQRNARQTRGNTAQGPGSASEANEAVRNTLEEIFTMVNEGREPSDEQVKDFRRTMLSSGRYRSDMEPLKQSNLFMLFSWVYYFEEEFSKAAQAGGRALQSNPGGSNAKATYTVMTILAGGEPELLARAEMLAKRRGQDYGGTENFSANLDFDPDKYMMEMTGLQLGAIDLDCVGSAVFSYKPGNKMACLILWQLEDKNAGSEERRQTLNDPCQMVEEEMDTMPGYPPGGNYWQERERPDYGHKEQQSNELASLKKIFAENYDNPAIGFVGINTDSCSNEDKVIKNLTKDPTPWVQALACKQSGAAEQFSEINNKGTHLFILSPKGRIMYAGQPGGFIPAMILKGSGVLKRSIADYDGPGQAGGSGHSSGGILDMFKNLTNSQDQGGAQSQQQYQRREKPAEEQRVADPDADLSMTDKYWCQKKLSQAKTMIDKGHTAGMFLGYRDGVEICKDILEKYPQTTYAQEARELLNQVPERYHNRYGITDEMLGR